MKNKILYNGIVVLIATILTFLIMGIIIPQLELTIPPPCSPIFYPC